MPLIDGVVPGTWYVYTRCDIPGIGYLCTGSISGMTYCEVGAREYPVFGLGVRTDRIILRLSSIWARRTAL